MKPSQTAADPATGGETHHTLVKLTTREAHRDMHKDNPNRTLGVDETTRRLAAIVESSQDAIISQDLNGTIQTWNREAEQMFGYAADEAIGRPVALIIPQDRLPEEQEVDARIRHGESVNHFETWRLKKGGARVPVSITASPVFDAAGRVIGASTIARDVQERLAADAVLLDLESRERDLQQRLFALVAASRTLFASPRVEDVVPAVVGLAQTMIAADAYAIWRLDSPTAAWQIAASLGISDDFASRLVHLPCGDDVNAVPVDEPLACPDLQDVPMPDERSQAYRQEGIVSMLAAPMAIGGRAVGTVVFYFRTPHEFSDVEMHAARSLSNLAAAAITTAELCDEQRRSREQADRATGQAAFLAEAGTALASSLDYEQTLRTVANLAVPQVADWCAVDVVNEQGEIERLAVAHSDPDKVELARTIQRRYPEPPDAAGGIRHAIRTGTPALYSEITDEMLAAGALDAEHARALMALQIRSVIIAPLTVHGRTFGALTFVQAESGRRYGERDARFAQELAYRAALAVENARAYRQANAANRAKDEFLATLSHELRTPLNAVLGWVRMLRSGSLSEAKVQRALEVIERNATAQLELVEDLLDVSRIITGKLRLEIGPVDLAAAIGAAVEAIQPAATAKRIAVSVETGAVPDPITGDRARLQQAVWNLLSNAIKFTPPGGRVGVTARRTDGDVEIEVSDTGEGIEPSVLPYVFDRFRQGESGTTRVHTGLGLGLAIVRHIVELHGGRAAVASDGKGRGATFRLSLPVVQAGRVGGAHAGTDQRRRVTAWPSLAGVRALIVDDDPDAAELLSEGLRGQGASVVAVPGAAAAFRAFQAERPDIVLSDIAMPNEDGLALIQRIRALPSDRGGRVPAIAVSAYARADDRERSLEAGFQLHVSKPIDIEQLVAAIASLAGHSNHGA